MTMTDPVCGMTVDPATARASADYDGTTYYFCCAGCAQKFRTAPDHYSKPRPAGPALVTLEAPKPTVSPAPAWANVAAPPARETKFPASAYVCPMCPEVHQEKPGPCPSCGMALEPETPVALTKTEYTCPMHPEIIRDQPGSCPICGMALEPRTVTATQEENPELRDMTRRIGVSALLTATLLGIPLTANPRWRPPPPTLPTPPLASLRSIPDHT